MSQVPAESQERSRQIQATRKWDLSAISPRPTASTRARQLQEAAKLRVALARVEKAAKAQWPSDFEHAAKYLLMERVEFILDTIQTIADFVGVIPGMDAVDAINGLVYLMRGRFLDAAFSAVSMLSFLGGLGYAGNAARYAHRAAEGAGSTWMVGSKLISRADDAADVARTAARMTDNVDDVCAWGKKLTDMGVPPKVLDYVGIGCFVAGTGVVMAGGEAAEAVAAADAAWLEQIDWALPVFFVGVGFLGYRLIGRRKRQDEDEQANLAPTAQPTSPRSQRKEPSGAAWPTLPASVIPWPRLPASVLSGKRSPEPTDWFARLSHDDSELVTLRRETTMTRELDSIADDVAGRTACDASTTTAVADSDAWFAALGAETSSAGLSREGPRKTNDRDSIPTAPRRTPSRQRRPAPSASTRESSESAAHRPKSKLLGSNRLARFWLIGCLLLASFFGIRALAPSSTSIRATQAPPTSTASLTPRLKNIEDICVGDRVRADNPTDEVDLAFGEDAVPEQWRHLELRLQKPDGSVSEISLLRPAAWVKAFDAEVGSTIPLNVADASIEGVAEVLYLGPCAPISRGDGRVVTATFKHVVSNVVDIRLKGHVAPIRTTLNHPFWSVDRHKFVPAEQLRAGEQLRGTNGALYVAEVAPRPGRATVYNLEVQTDHVFHVSADGVLVHNSKQCTLLTQLRSSADAQRALLRAALAQPGTGKIAHHLIPLQARTEFKWLMEKGARGGFNINGKVNGILLDAVDHVYGHPVYNKVVLEELGRIEKIARSQRLSDKAVAGLLEDTAGTLRNAIDGGTFKPWF